MSSKVANRCHSRTKAGKPCKAAPTANGLCFFHANPDKVSELGRVGGKSRKAKSTGIFDDWQAALADVEGVHDSLNRVISAGLSGFISLDRASQNGGAVKLSITSVGAAKK